MCNLNTVGVSQVYIKLFNPDWTGRSLTIPISISGINFCVDDGKDGCKSCSQFVQAKCDKGTKVMTLSCLPRNLQPAVKVSACKVLEQPGRPHVSYSMCVVASS